jgi:hypothetical protein
MALNNCLKDKKIQYGDIPVHEGLLENVKKSN